MFAKHFLLLAFCVTGLNSLFHTPLLADSDLIEAAVDAVASNKEKLGAYSLTLTERFVSSKAPGTAPLLSKLPQGFKVVDSPPQESPSSELTVGKDFLERRYFDSADACFQVWQYDGGLWNELQVEKRIAIIRRKPEQLPAVGSVELQVSPTFGQSLEDLIKNARNAEAEYIENADFGDGSIAVELDRESGSSLIVFSSKERFLPVQIKEIRKNGEIVFDRQFEYELVTERDALRVSRIKTSVPPHLQNGQQDPLLFTGEIIQVVSDFRILGDDEAYDSRMTWDQGWIVTDMMNWQGGAHPP
ncbi:MAG: hypothetical protein R3C53_04995 [Pirellulaceae bacterium]